MKITNSSIKDLYLRRAINEEITVHNIFNYQETLIGVIYYYQTYYFYLTISQKGNLYLRYN